MDSTLQAPPPRPAQPSLRRRSFTRAHAGLLLLTLWCAAALTFLVTAPGAIWLRAWGPMGVNVFLETSSTMQPTIGAGDVVLAVLHTVQEPNPQRGDIVIFHHDDGLYFGRVAGMRGNTAQFIEQNGDRVYKEQAIPEGEVFVLSDNPNHAFDSRDEKVGTVPISDILGYPVLILWSKDRSRIGSVPR